PKAEVMARLKATAKPGTPDVWIERCYDAASEPPFCPDCGERRLEQNDASRLECPLCKFDQPDLTATDLPSNSDRSLTQSEPPTAAPISAVVDKPTSEAEPEPNPAEATAEPSNPTMAQTSAEPGPTEPNDALPMADAPPIDGFHSSS